MSDFSDEDKFVKQMVIATSTALAMVVLVSVLLVTVLVSANFNILQWLE